jgi:acyl-CoA reductase-like NAD-dependent aldehyde dehydrogenase
MLTMSSGGNDPAIVCDDVDIEKVAPQVMTQAQGEFA